MNLSSAIKEMESSKDIKIRRKSWPHSIYMKITDNIPTMYHKEASFFSYDLSIINSNDWIILDDEERKLLSFLSVLEELKNGKAAQLSSWDKETYIVADRQNLMQMKETKYNFVPAYPCFISDDWEIIL